MGSSSAPAEIRRVDTLAELEECAAITNVVEPFVRVTAEQLARRTADTFLLHPGGGYAFVAPSSFPRNPFAMVRVRPDCRGTGVGSALEIAWASAHGFSELVTTTHELNAPMRAVKAKLVYVERAQTIEVRGELP